MIEIADSLNIKLLIAYNGTNFHGLAPNFGVRTVVGEISSVLAPYTGDIDIVMSGRTDSGVHAWGQVLNFFARSDRADPRKIMHIINSKLAPEIVVRDALVVDNRFSARFSATARHYKYRVQTASFPDPFSAVNTWWLADELDINSMNQAASSFVGSHDFSSFCRLPKKPENERPASLIREVKSALWTSSVDGLHQFDISGSAFCHQMVRSVVGFLVAVGKGKRNPEEVVEVIAAKDRSKADQLAPPNGLTLWEVHY